MSGRGRIERVATETAAPVYVFGNDYRWHRAIEPIDNGRDQVDVASFDVVVGVGPGRSFGARWTELNPGVPIGLIPCAMGGSSISDWGRNLDDASLYGSMLKRWRAASALGEVRGVLFFQGESDATAERAGLWTEQFQRWVADVRADIGAPNLPVVFAQLGDGRESVDPEAWKRLQAMQAEVELPHSAMIKTSDLALSDGMHFTSESYHSIGRRFAEAMHPLTAGGVSGLPTSQP